ncbi:hypothetical protein BaRGS_00000740, partial [Batillaria attramentaria]
IKEARRGIEDKGVSLSIQSESWTRERSKAWDRGQGRVVVNTVRVLDKGEKPGVGSKTRTCGCPQGRRCRNDGTEFTHSNTRCHGKKEQRRR